MDSERVDINMEGAYEGYKDKVIVCNIPYNEAEAIVKAMGFVFVAGYEAFEEWGKE